ncbi:MAG: winged helix-turn-helix transcriptional regulator [Gemmatimonadaceae bacterium]|nr:winged helix-turn-helix transcriptional regulator [Gemmatimonadaceae bacterium]
MPDPTSIRPLVTFTVTPRFELFYALQAIAGGGDGRTRDWCRDTRRRLPNKLRKTLDEIAPSPLLWPLLADSLRDASPALDARELIDYLRKMDDAPFQRAVLGGVFKGQGSVDGLLSGDADLGRTVTAESETQGRLLSLLGLYPFDRKNPSAMTLAKMVSDPGAYRAGLVSALESFWNAAFDATWASLEPQMRDTARQWAESLSDAGFAGFANSARLPITEAKGAIVSVRGSTRVALRSVNGIIVIPSAFNAARLWAAYPDEKHRTRFFIPLFDSNLAVTDTEWVSAALAFKALGDTTRYAMASMIARTPMTSVALARTFGVSKPTISHHVQLLRSAGLLEETDTENGVVLALNRRIVERISAAAAQEMFSGLEGEQVIRRTRRTNKR